MGQAHCTVELTVFLYICLRVYTSNYRNYENARIKGQSHHLNQKNLFDAINTP
jgi:hypothetical protein